MPEYFDTSRNRPGQSAPPLLGESGPGSFDELAREAESWAGIFSRRADQLAQSEARTAGEAAGSRVRDEDGKLLPMAKHDRPGTIYGQAFQQAAKTAYFAGVNRDIKQIVTQARIDSNQDPVEFEKKVNNARTGYLGQIDPEHKQLVTDAFSAASDPSRMALSERYRTNLESESAALAESEAGSIRDDAMLAARSGDERTLSILSSQYEGLLGSMLHEGLDQAAATRWLSGKMTNFKSSAMSQVFVGGVEDALREGRISVARERLSEWENNTKVQGVRVSDRDAAVIQARQMIGLAESKEGEHKTVYNKANKHVIPLLELGGDVNSAALDRLDSGLSPDDRQKLHHARLFNEQLARPMVKSHPSEWMFMLDAARKTADENPDGPAPYFYFTLQKLEGNLTKKLKSDPMRYLLENGLADVKPLDYSDPDNLTLGLMARSRISEEQSEKLSVEVNPLSDVELRELDTVLDAMPLANQGAMLAAFSKNLKPAQARAVFDALDSAGSSLLAAVGQIHLRGDADIARKVLVGHEMIQENPSGMTSFSKIEDASDYLLRHIYDFDKSVHHKQGMTDAIVAYYSYQNKKNAGKSETDVNQKKLYQALQDVVGGVIEWNSEEQESRIVPPYRFMSGDEFSDWIEDMTVDQFLSSVSAPPNGDPEEILEMIREHGILRSLVVRGEYLVFYKDRQRKMYDTQGNQLKLIFREMQNEPDR